jgi:hypothetical protein
MGQRGVAPRDLWCVAKNNAADQALQEAINWACGQGGANCGPIQQGGACYDSNDIQRTASWAFNDYYLKNGLTDDACYFSNTAALTSLNPSNWILYIFELNIILGSFLFLVSGSVRFEVWLVVVGVSCIFVIALLILD